MKQALLALSLSMILAACGSDGGGDNDDGARTGHLLFNGISGVHYETASQSGTTGSDGSFRYRPGETISFSIGPWQLASGIQAKDWMSPLDFEPDIIADIESSTLADCLDLDEAAQSIDELITSDPVLTLGAHACKEETNAKKGVIANKLALLLTMDDDRDSSNGIQIKDYVTDGITRFEEQNPGEIDSIIWNPVQNPENTDPFGNPENTGRPEVRLINSICFPEQTQIVCDEPDVGRQIISGSSAVNFLLEELRLITRHIGEDVFIENAFYEIPQGDSDLRVAQIRLIREDRNIIALQAVSSDQNVVTVQGTTLAEPSASFFATGTRGQSATVFINIKYEGDYRWIRKSVRVKII